MLPRASRNVPIRHPYGTHPELVEWAYAEKIMSILGFSQRTAASGINPLAAVVVQYYEIKNIFAENDIWRYCEALQ